MSTGYRAYYEEEEDEFERRFKAPSPSDWFPSSSLSNSNKNSKKTEPSTPSTHQDKKHAINEPAEESGSKSLPTLPRPFSLNIPNGTNSSQSSSTIKPPMSRIKLGAVRSASSPKQDTKLPDETIKMTLRTTLPASSHEILLPARPQSINFFNNDSFNNNQESGPSHGQYQSVLEIQKELLLRREMRRQKYVPHSLDALDKDAGMEQTHDEHSGTNMTFSPLQPTQEPLFRASAEHLHEYNRTETSFYSPPEGHKISEHVENLDKEQGDADKTQHSEQVQYQHEAQKPNSSTFYQLGKDIRNDPSLYKTASMMNEEHVEREDEKLPGDNERSSTPFSSWDVTQNASEGELIGKVQHPSQMLVEEKDNGREHSPYHTNNLVNNGSRINFGDAPTTSSEEDDDDDLDQYYFAMSQQNKNRPFAKKNDLDDEGYGQQKGHPAPTTPNHDEYSLSDDFDRLNLKSPAAQKAQSISLMSIGKKPTAPSDLFLKHDDPIPFLDTEDDGTLSVQSAVGGAPCSRCSKRNEPDANYCGRCGLRLSGPPVIGEDCQTSIAEIALSAKASSSSITTQVTSEVKDEPMEESEGEIRRHPVFAFGPGGSIAATWPTSNGADKVFLNSRLPKQKNKQPLDKALLRAALPDLIPEYLESVLTPLSPSILLKTADGTQEPLQTALKSYWEQSKKSDTADMHILGSFFCLFLAEIDDSGIKREEECKFYVEKALKWLHSLNPIPWSFLPRDSADSQQEINELLWLGRPEAFLEHVGDTERDWMAAMHYASRSFKNSDDYALWKKVSQEMLARMHPSTAMLCRALSGESLGKRELASVLLPPWHHAVILLTAYRADDSVVSEWLEHFLEVNCHVGYLILSMLHKLNKHEPLQLDRVVLLKSNGVLRINFLITWLAVKSKFSHPNDEQDVVYGFGESGMLRDALEKHAKVVRTLGMTRLAKDLEIEALKLRPVEHKEQPSFTTTKSTKPSLIDQPEPVEQKSEELKNESISEQPSKTLYFSQVLPPKPAPELPPSYPALRQEASSFQPSIEKDERPTQMQLSSKLSIPEQPPIIANNSLPLTHPSLPQFDSASLWQPQIGASDSVIPETVKFIRHHSDDDNDDDDENEAKEDEQVQSEREEDEAVLKRSASVSNSAISAVTGISLLNRLKAVFTKQPNTDETKGDLNGGGKKKPVKANLGEPNTFRYDEALGRWVDDADASTFLKPQAPPPPPTSSASTHSLSSSSMNPVFSSNPNKPSSSASRPKYAKAEEGLLSAPLDKASPGNAPLLVMPKPSIVVPVKPQLPAVPVKNMTNDGSISGVFMPFSPPAATIVAEGKKPLTANPLSPASLRPPTLQSASPKANVPSAKAAKKPETSLDAMI